MMKKSISIEAESLSGDHLLDFLRTDKLLATTLDSIYDGVYVVDGERKILFWNRGASVLTGYTREEVIGRRCADAGLSHVDSRGELLCQRACPLVQTLQTGQEQEKRVFPRHKQGHRFPVQTHVGPIIDASGKIVAAIEVFRDISEEEQHRVLQEKFARLIRKYVSVTTFDEVVDQARSDRQSSTRRRDVSVLCLDMVGFTSFSEGRDPAHVVGMLNEVFSTCDAITRKFHGDIDKFIGDALIAVFADANDALDAARSIQQTMVQLNHQRNQRGEPEVLLRVGLNSGEVIQGEIGTSERKDLTVIGDVVNTASRIEKACKPGSWRISAATYLRLNEARAQSCQLLTKLVPKGKHQAVEIYGPSDH